MPEVDLPFTPRPWQLPLIEDRHRSMVAVVHRRAGKSTAFVWRGLTKALTEDRRRVLAKHVGHEGENAKIAIRNVRRDALQQVKDLLKEKLITEDDESRVDDEIQKLTDRAVKDVDAVVKAKEEELMAL